MHLYYLIALLPVIIGLALSCLHKKINIQEWIISSVLSFLVAGIFHISTISGMQQDVEYWSGKVVDAQYSPEWTEYWEDDIYRTESRWKPAIDSDGNTYIKHYTVQVFDHWEPRNTVHPADYESNVSFGGEFTRLNISRNTFFDYANAFGSIRTNFVNKSTSKHNSKFQSGDHNMYYTSVGNSGAVIPYITQKSWKNKAKASPSTFSYSKVPDGIPVFNYPDKVGFQSGRLLGDAANKINILEFDKMNSRLNPSKRVNVIVIGFLNSPDAKLGAYQEAKWIGGKKNDLVICYGIGALEGNEQGIVWTKCFSWCENKKMKEDIEKLFLNNPIDNTILIPLEKMIREGYTLYDWTKLDYIKVKPTNKCLLWYMITVLLINGVMYFAFLQNDWGDEDY